MNLEALGNLGDFIGGIAVLVTLIYLAFQIRQNTSSVQQSNRIATANTEISIRGGYGQLNRSIVENNGLAAALVKAQSDERELDDVEQLRVQVHLTQMANQWHAMEVAYEQKLIPHETYAVMFDDHRFFVAGYPALRPLLRAVLENYPALADTAAFKSVDRLLKEHGS